VTICGACLHVAPRKWNSSCPGCGGKYRDRITDGQLTSLQAIANGRRDIIPNQRDWLGEHGLITVGALGKVRRGTWSTRNARQLALTDKGSRALELGVALAASPHAQLLDRGQP
jgi:hypothetical protein